MKTNNKLLIAKILLKILLLLDFKKKFIIYRNKIKWSLDITEGIDLSIFLFGSFQKKLIFSMFNLIKKQKKNFPFFNIIDVGSNIGDKTLSLTKLLLDHDIKNFKVFSIEPTEYAFNKQIKNVKLNPTLKKKISNHKLFISSKKNKPNKIYSSWNLNNNQNRHQIHGGILKSIKRKTKISSLDKFIIHNKIANKIIVKIDVDGFELDVLKSLQKTLKKTNPIVFMEYAPYAFEEYGSNVLEFNKFLKRYKYKIYDLSFKRLNSVKISDGSSKDIILIKDKLI
jgi:FkbM family methyltransferase